jgi:hypothetical protein
LDCGKWIFSDESKVVIGKNNNIFIWRKGDEKYKPYLGCPAPRTKLYVMVWECVCFGRIGNLFDCCVRNINAQKYKNMLDNNLWPVIAMHS